VDQNLLEQINLDRAARRATILITDLKTGGQRVVRESELDSGDPIHEDLLAAFRGGKSRSLETESGELFLNVFTPPTRLIMTGAVHISQALYPMARACGHDVVIVDPREAFGTNERFPDIELITGWPGDHFPNLGIDAYAAVVTLTHDPKIDDPALEFALNSKAFYIGALGSRKTHARRVERLTAAGFSEDQLARIAAPVGLDIGAKSPSEIAVSILAQLTAALRLRASGDKEG
jgi:xanthine dehydrogenase accessory factor